MRIADPRRLETLIFAFVFGLTAYFYNGYGWNQTARYDPIWAFVEPGAHRYTLEIDDFVVDPDRGLNTGDFARSTERSDHYYSNKAPGASLLGIPAYFLLYHTETLVGLDPVSIKGVLVNAYLINLWVTVLPLAISAVFFFRLASTFAAERTRALFVTLVLYAGTLMLPFSTSLWGHTTAAAFAVMALACFVRPGRRMAMWCGFLVGLAVLTDYAAAPLAATLVVATAMARGRRERLAALVLGGMGPLAAFALYHWALFGSPVRLASSYSVSAMLDQSRVLGLFGPVSLRALYGLTFSTFRGIFVFMPVLLLSLYAIRYVPADGHRHFWWMSTATMLLLLLVNSTFNGWHGGTSSGARYQILALPLYVLLLALLPSGRGAHILLGVLAALSFANMFVLTAVSPITSGTLLGSPLLFSYAKLWRTLRIELGFDPVPVGGPLSRGSVHVYPVLLMRAWPISLNDPLIERYAVFNLGEQLLGLRGVASLLPALVGGSGLGAWMMQVARRGR